MVLVPREIFFFYQINYSLAVWKVKITYVFYRIRQFLSIIIWAEL